MPRPRSLEPTAVAVAALAVIDRDGLAALTMRAVARELRLSTMGLYRYVDDRAQLEALVVDLVLGSVDSTRPPGPTWREQVIVLARRVHEVMGRHPAVVPLTLTHRHRSAGVLRWSETVLGILTDAGLEDEDRVIALRGLLSYLVGALQLEHLGPLSGPGTQVIAALPEEEFPLMAATARRAGRVAPAREFEGGLGLVLDGIQSLITRSA